MSVNKDIISKEQMCKILHMSKRRASYMLENGLIPCVDTGMQTHRFKIRMSDVKRYRKDVKLHPEKYKLQNGVIIDGKRHKDSLSFERTPKNIYAFQKFLQTALGIDGALTVSETAKLTGYQEFYVAKLIQNNQLTSVKIFDKRYVTEDDMVDFFAGEFAARIRVKSEFHKGLLREFINEIGQQ